MCPIHQAVDIMAEVATAVMAVVATTEEDQVKAIDSAVSSSPVEEDMCIIHYSGEDPDTILQTMIQMSFR